MKKVETVRFENTLLKVLDKIYTIYDLAAVCYEHLIDTVGDQRLFLGGYTIVNENAAAGNPNLKDLGRLSVRIEHILQKREELGMSFPECLFQIQMILRNFELKEYGESFLNDATIPFFVLLAIDRYAYWKCGSCTRQSPLNQGYCEKSYIYLNAKTNLLDEAAEMNQFSDVIHGFDIRSQLKHLIILEKKELPEGVGIPKVVELRLKESDEKKHRIIKSRKLRIAVIPFGEQKMLEFPVDKGALFYVRYNEYHRRNGVERALHLLELAIEKKANVIIFPEFVCSQEIQDAIQDRLKAVYKSAPQKLESLFLVIAGSGWTEDSNNVSSIFSYHGRLLGRQYKFSAFTDQKHRGCEMIEDLKDPGKETTIVGVEGIGKILVGICRDISERSYTRMLARVFQPQLLLTPAWSPSVHIGFKEQFSEISAENHRTCAILCNCCEAVRSEEKWKTDVGIVVVPYKKGSVITGKERILTRKEICRADCGNGGCLFIVNLNFQTDAVRDAKTIYWNRFVLRH